MKKLFYGMDRDVVCPRQLNVAGGTDFETKKAKFTVEHFVEGEDATSGYDYLYYKSGGQDRKDPFDLERES
jgi:hypothetical protein